MSSNLIKALISGVNPRKSLFISIDLTVASSAVWSDVLHVTAAWRRANKSVFGEYPLPFLVQQSVPRLLFIDTFYFLAPLPLSLHQGVTEESTLQRNHDLCCLMH